MLEGIPSEMFGRRHLFIIDNQCHRFAAPDPDGSRPAINRRALNAPLKLLTTEFISDNDDLREPIQSLRGQKCVARPWDERLTVHEKLHAYAVQTARHEGPSLFEQGGYPVSRRWADFQNRLPRRRQYPRLKPLSVLRDDNVSGRFRRTAKDLKLAASRDDQFQVRWKRDAGLHNVIPCAPVLISCRRAFV